MKYVMGIITVFQVYQICMSLFTFKNVNKPFILQGYRPQILFIKSLFGQEHKIHCNNGVKY